MGRLNTVLGAARGTLGSGSHTCAPVVDPSTAVAALNEARRLELNRLVLAASAWGDTQRGFAPA